MIVIHRAFLLTRESLKKGSIKSFNSELFITTIQSALISLHLIDLYILFDMSVVTLTCLNEI